jgi:hypothetical protein
MRAFLLEYCSPPQLHRVILPYPFCRIHGVFSPSKCLNGCEQQNKKKAKEWRQRNEWRALYSFASIPLPLSFPISLPHFLDRFEFLGSLPHQSKNIRQTARIII